ncbi:MAG TPA: hypothetical protein VM056_03170 [Terriglobales bacterium]|nr:hypothetical protein [Terriglobales bacterium]
MPRSQPWFFNRVYLGLIIFAVLVGFWEFKWKPQYRPYYEQGVRYYQAGKYVEALAQFDHAYAIAPNAMDVVMMQGWTNLKLNRFDDSRMYFNRVLRIDPRLEEAQIGSAFVALETGKGVLDYKILVKYLGKRINDPNVAILVAGALLQDGKTFEAAEMYKRLSSDENYGPSARIEHARIFGLEGTNEQPPDKLPKRERPAQMQTSYRSANGGLLQLRDGKWESFYVNGVNLGPGAPGYYPSAPPHNVQLYKTWLKDTEELGANVIRTYTLLPPAFYRAYKQHLNGGGKISLYQQIWVGDPPNKDLYEPKFVEHIRAEIRYVVDALHGAGDVPPKRARGHGIYDQDVSNQVSAILLGRELEASVAIQTNVINGGKQRFQGKYISIANGTATEVWFAEMLEYLVAYETDTYNWQHPVAIVNWPPLDPLYHPTEAPNIEEVKYRIRRGEKLEMPKDVDDDNDTVAIDEAKYKVQSDFYAGLFASYHVYPYYPDFLLFDPKYLNARDRDGVNPMFGYIKELKAHIPHPLVITEYGIPDSMGISHFHPYGWHHGGQTEDQQAVILRQLTRSLRESGTSGGAVFALVDEWYKHNWLTVDFENPVDRAALWMNELDPEKRYGLIGYRTAKWKLFLGEPTEWDKETTLYAKDRGKSGQLSLQTSSDEAFVYLRIKGACVECLDKPGGADRMSYVVALNTIPQRAGLRQLPFGNASVSTGSNFVLYLGGGGTARLLVADNYNPFQIAPKPGVPNETELSYRRSFSPSLEARGTFQELLVETNRRRFARDGTMFPGQRYSRSVMRYVAPKDREKDSLAEWFADVKTQTIVVRISWGKLLITDPSSRQAFFGFDSNARVQTAPSIGITMSLFELKTNGDGRDLSAMTIVDSLPEMSQGQIREPKKVEWKTWEKVALEPYRKKSYAVMQKEFLEPENSESKVAEVVGAGSVVDATKPKRAGTR